MSHRGWRASARLMLCALMMCSMAAAQAASGSGDVVIKNATVLTVTKGTIKNGSVLIHNGKIAEVGQTVNAPAGATVIDASGKFVTPGIIDSHSHIAMS